MRGYDRIGFVVVQLSTARVAFHAGDLVTARATLRSLRTTDFFGGPAASESHLAVLRDHRSSEEEVREAMSVLLNLRPVGIGAA
jgi:hypothetical protein